MFGSYGVRERFGKVTLSQDRRYAWTREFKCRQELVKNDTKDMIDQRKSLTDDNIRVVQEFIGLDKCVGILLNNLLIVHICPLETISLR